MRSLFVTVFLSCSIVSFSQLEIKRQDHRIVLYSGEIVNGMHLEYVSAALNQATFKIDEEIYASTEVKYFQNSHGYFANLGKLHGDNCERYALRIQKGKVNLFEEIEMGVYSGDDLKTEGESTMQDPMLATGEMFEYYNIGDQPIREANFSNLSVDLKDNEESVKHLKRHRYYKWLQMGLLSLGGGVVAYDVIRQSGGPVKFNPFMAFGVVLGGGSYFLEAPKDDELWLAADSYNTEMTITEVK